MQGNSQQAKRQPWRVIAAPNGFKGTLSAWEAAAFIAQGVQHATQEADVICLPVADGGQETVEVLVRATGGRWQSCRVHDALGRPRMAQWGVLSQRRGAVEVAAACGLALLSEGERDPHRASSFGAGELIAQAANAGLSELFIGLGGSATNDGGAGLLEALGARFFDASGRQRSPFTEGVDVLGEVVRVDLHPVKRRLGSLRLTLCDVKTLLCGVQGASALFGPQKGVGPQEVAVFDRWLAQWGTVLAQASKREVAQLPGSGAAGGCGAALAAVGATLADGAATVLRVMDFDQKLQGAALVITGEGSSDLQTLQGKAPWAVAQAAQRAGVPCVLLAGALRLSAQQWTHAGFSGAWSLVAEPQSLSEALARSGERLRETAYAVALFYAAIRKQRVVEEAREDG
ncbi:MAG: glycerate kinase [Firmicutes bacterium]|nr:glycerate kinase [Bacillota bacterium]